MRRCIAFLAVIALLCLNGFILNAQDRCGTVINLEKMKVEEPQRYKRFMEHERFIESYAKQ